MFAKSVIYYWFFSQPCFSYWHVETMKM